MIKYFVEKLNTVKNERSNDLLIISVLSFFEGAKLKFVDRQVNLSS